MTLHIDPVKHARLFENPFYDASDPRLSDEEIQIIRRMACGEELGQERYYVAESDACAVGWAWMTYPPYPNQWDGPVVRLISRGVIRSVRCGGGYTSMIFTDRAREVFGLERSPEYIPAPFTGPESFVALEKYRQTLRAPRAKHLRRRVRKAVQR